MTRHLLLLLLACPHLHPRHRLPPLLVVVVAVPLPFFVVVLPPFVFASPPVELPFLSVSPQGAKSFHELPHISHETKYNKRTSCLCRSISFNNSSLNGQELGIPGSLGFPGESWFSEFSVCFFSTFKSLTAPLWILFCGSLGLAVVFLDFLLDAVFARQFYSFTLHLCQNNKVIQLFPSVRYNACHSLFLTMVIIYAAEKSGERVRVNPIFTVALKLRFNYPLLQADTITDS